MLFLHVSLSYASSSAPAEPVPRDQVVGRSSRAFRFGPFLLQPERQLLLKRDVPVRIGGRALDLLTILVERAGEIVSKGELISRAWPDTFVEEGNLKVNIGGLRRALGECPANPCFIATVVGRGYRFIAPVDALVFRLDEEEWMLPVGDGHAAYRLSPSSIPDDRGQRDGDERDISAR
jgi:DNA-binding winged helix-turn-helix (wHTH) protein